MQAKLIGYQHRDTVIHRLSGAGKLLFFILVSLAGGWTLWREKCDLAGNRCLHSNQPGALLSAKFGH
ncbi:ABC transporter permease [Streptococcus pneumoniae]|nr:ABC transporter permease [Streptococcus pneumoniae]